MTFQPDDVLLRLQIAVHDYLDTVLPVEFIGPAALDLWP